MMIAAIDWMSPHTRSTLSADMGFKTDFSLPRVDFRLFVRSARWHYVWILSLVINGLVQPDSRFQPGGNWKSVELFTTMGAPAGRDVVEWEMADTCDLLCSR